MLSKKFTKKIVATLVSMFMFSTICVNFGSFTAFAIPAAEDKYLEGDRQFTVGLLNTEVPAGSNPGAVDFNGNGKYDENEMLPLKGTEDFKAPASVEKSAENFMSIVGIEGGVLRSSTVVIREDVKDYKKSNVRDALTGGYIYIKVKFGGNVGEALKNTIDKAVEEVKKNKILLEQGKGSQISLIEQETLATVIQNSLGMLYESGELVNKDFNLIVDYSTGSKSDQKKITVLDLIMDSTVSKVNQYTNKFNAPRIVDEEGNIYFKVYGLPTGSEVTNIKFQGELLFPSLVESSVVRKVSQQSEISGAKGIIPYVDPMLTEAINVDNSNPLDPMTIKSTVSYYTDLSVNSKGEVSSKGNGIVEYIGPFSSDDKSHGYKHSTIRRWNSFL